MQEKKNLQLPEQNNTTLNHRSTQHYSPQIQDSKLPKNNESQTLNKLNKMIPSQAHKKQLLLFLIILLTLTLLILISLTQKPNVSTNTPNLHLNYKNTPKQFTLTIKLLTFNRLNSLARCLNSLANAQYDAASRVNLHIFIDHFALNFNNISGADLDGKLKGAREILDFVDGYKWDRGEKVVHYRADNVGLQAQWIEAWWPRDDDDFAFVVEDDLEVSPLYYQFIKSVLIRYYYDKGNFSPSVFGVTLQRPRFVPGKHGNKLQIDSNTRLFLYQLVGTWGQVLFPGPWKEFRLWYDINKAKGIKPLLDGMVTTGWYKRIGEKIWTPWFIKFIHSRGYFNIYTNFPHEAALSTSHRDAGVNYGKSAGPDSQLLDERSNDLNFKQLPSLSDLKWYDFCFREVVPNRVVRSTSELRTVLQSVQKQGNIILLNLFGVSETLARNLLCQLERLNIWNYILMGPHSDLFVDLARRGHPVIDADQLFDMIKPSKLMKKDFILENLVKAYIVKECLELGYSSWVVDGDMLLVTKDLFLGFNDAAYDVYIGKNIDILYIKSSTALQKFWKNDFIQKLMATIETSPGKNSLSKDAIKFANFVAQLLEKRGLGFKLLDETRFGLKIDSSSISKSLLGDEKKVIYWLNSDSDLIQKHLEELGMWVIDGESSCLAVVCNKS